MTRLTDRLERDLREIAAGADPSPSAWESIVARLGEGEAAEVDLVVLGPSAWSRRRAWITAAAAAFVVIAGAIAVLSRAGNDHSSAPADTGPTMTFESPRNGYSVDLPEGSTIIPATQLYGFSRELDGGPDVGVDVVETGSGTVFNGASKEFEEWNLIDARIDERIDEYDALPGGCGVPRSQQAEYTIDGQPGRIAACPGRVEATVIVPGRLYLFALLDDGPDVRADFDALAASIRLTQETAVDFPALDTTFDSPTYGYSMGFFDRGGLAPATERWDPLPQGTDDRTIDSRFDAVETGLLAYFGAASTAIPTGVSIDDWVDSIDLFPEPSMTDSAWERCYVPRRQQEEITIDGQPGRILACPEGGTVATVVAGGRLYLFILLSGDTEARPYFDSWMATIDLTPETAVDTPEVVDITTMLDGADVSTFVSPTYGYSFGYIDRGGLVPATEVWDPVTRRLDELDFDPQFDAQETGYAAYFEGASAAIPDGVSIDDWIDEYVTPGACGVPRSQQEEITIDGQSGRVAECPELIEATVVAGGRLYLFALGHMHNPDDARAFFDDWVATIELTPETATVP